MKKPSLSRLIESAIGRLALHRIKSGERNVISDDSGALRDRILLLQSLINGASIERRTSPKVTKSLLAIMRSVEITCYAPEFIVFLVRKYPGMMSDIATDERMSRRIKHLYRVAEIGSCFSAESLDRLNGGIDSVRRKVFEISQE